MVSTAAAPARQAIGLPPKVDACIPGTSDAATGGRAIITPAATPPANALAQVRMSGTTPSMLVGEPLAGSAHAGLDLVKNQAARPVGRRVAAGREDSPQPGC